MTPDAVRGAYVLYIGAGDRQAASPTPDYHSDPPVIWIFSMVMPHASSLQCFTDELPAFVGFLNSVTCETLDYTRIAYTAFICQFFFAF